MKHVKRFFKGVYKGILESRQHRAAEELAEFLIRENSDFRNWSVSELTTAIKTKDRVIRLDKKGL
jgi:TPP-dependent 2-oxoacid decarboxylase